MSTRLIEPASIEEYILAQPPGVRATLRKVRSTIRKAAPTASKLISYRMPAFALNGVLIHFAAFKRHVGLYPPVRGGNEKLMQRKAEFEGPKENLIFPLDEPIPYALIASIAKLRVRQNLAKSGRGDTVRIKRRKR